MSAFSTFSDAVKNFPRHPRCVSPAQRIPRAYCGAAGRVPIESSSSPSSVFILRQTNIAAFMMNHRRAQRTRGGRGGVACAQTSDTRQLRRASCFTGGGNLLAPSLIPVLNPHPARGVQLCIISRKKNVGWKWAEGSVRLREEKCLLHPKLPLPSLLPLLRFSSRTRSMTSHFSRVARL